MLMCFFEVYDNISAHSLKELVIAMRVHADFVFDDLCVGEFDVVGDEIEHHILQGCIHLGFKVHSQIKLGEVGDTPISHQHTHIDHCGV